MDTGVDHLTPCLHKAGADSFLHQNEGENKGGMDRQKKEKRRKGRERKREKLPRHRLKVRKFADAMANFRELIQGVYAMRYQKQAIVSFTSGGSQTLIQENEVIFFLFAVTTTGVFFGISSFSLSPQSGVFFCIFFFRCHHYWCMFF